MTASGPQDPKNAPASLSMIEQCERQLRDYFVKIAENDEARANAYYEALSPMLFKQALGQMLGSNLDDMFGRATAPQEYQPSKTADRAIRNLHESMKKETGEHRFPAFQSIEDIKRFTAKIDQDRMVREREEKRADIATEIMAKSGAGTELVTQPYSTSDWVTTYFAPPSNEDAQRDLEFQSRDVSDKPANKGRRNFFGMLFGAKEEEVQKQKVRQDSVYYLAPTHKGGPIVVQGRVKIGNAPTGVTIIATGDVHVDYVGAGAFIVAGGNITVGETGSRAILIAGENAKANYVGSYARVYAREHAQVDACANSIVIRAGVSTSYPTKKWRERPEAREAAELVKDFCDVMDTIQNEPKSITALRQLFAEGIVEFSAGALNVTDVPVLQAPLPPKALPAPRPQTLEEAFNRFAGKAVAIKATRVEIRTDIPYRMETHLELLENNLIKELKDTAKARGLSVRFNYPGAIMMQDFNDKRLNVEIKKDADGAWRIGSNFSLY